MQMIMEVTEKEAMEIYSQRYLDEKRSGKFLLLKVIPIVAIAFVASYLVMITTNKDWLGYVTLITLGFPPLYFWMRFLRRSGKYAKSQIEEIK